MFIKVAQKFKVFDTFTKMPKNVGENHKMMDRKYDHRVMNKKYTTPCPIHGMWSSRKTS